MALDAAWKFLKAADFEDIRGDIGAYHDNAKRTMEELAFEHERAGTEQPTRERHRNSVRRELRLAMQQMFGHALNRVDLNHALASIGEKTRAKEGFDLQDRGSPWHYSNEQFEIDAETGLPYTHGAGKFPNPPGWSTPGVERFRNQGTVEPEKPLDEQ